MNSKLVDPMKCLKIITFSTISGIMIYLLGTTISMLLYPNYSFFSQYFSDLGIGRFGIVFNLTVILTGILIYPFFPLSYFLLKPSKEAKIMLLISSFTGIIASLFLIFVGIYDKSENSLRAHQFVTLGFFISMTLTIFFWALGNYFIERANSKITNRENKKSKKNQFDLISNMVVIIIPLFFIIFTGTFDPFLQKITVYTFLAYFGFAVVKLNGTEL